MNPLNLAGREFLAFYVQLFLVALILATLLRWLLRFPAGDPPQGVRSLAPYEAAFLKGGNQLAITAAVTRLVHADALHFEPATRRFSRKVDALPPDAPPFDKAVHAAVWDAAGHTIHSLRDALADKVTPIRRRLEELGLVLDAGQAFLPRVLPILVLLLVAALGVVKINLGAVRGYPVTYLVILTALTCITAFLAFGRPVHRTRRGDRVLADLRSANAALDPQARHRPAHLSGTDLALAVGLFGIEVLAVGPFSQLQTALGPKARFTPDASTGAGCGSSCSSSGCGGGGCGGCGG